MPRTEIKQLNRSKSSSTIRLLHRSLLMKLRKLDRLYCCRQVMPTNTCNFTRSRSHHRITCKIYTSITIYKSPSAESEVEAKAESNVNSAPAAEASTDSPPRSSRPLSPYTNYPDLKPPSSPSPSTT